MILQWNPQGHLFDHQKEFLRENALSILADDSCTVATLAATADVVYFSHHFLPHGKL